MAKYTDKQIERYLIELMLADGNITKARGMILVKYEDDIPDRTMRNWRDSTHAALYQRLEANRSEIVMQRMQDQSERAAGKFGITEERVVDVLNAMPADALAKANLGTLINVAKGASVGKGINVTKVLEFRQHPTRPSGDGSPGEILRALKRLVPDLFIEAEGEEIPPAELPPGETKP